MALVFILLWCGVGGLIGWAIGNGKGRPAEGFWLGFLLGVIGWIIAAFMAPSPEVADRRAAESVVLQAQVEQAETAKSLRACPYCAEMIQPAAVVCRFCGREVEPVGTEPVGEEAVELRMKRLAERFPYLIAEGHAAMARLPRPPSDGATWLEKYCEARRNGKSDRRATKLAEAALNQWW